MPELPEVENVRRGLTQLLPEGVRVTSLTFNRADLRWKIPSKAMRAFIGKPLLFIERRAKYLLLHFQTGIWMNHLGMTGSWRERVDDRTHDHVLVETDHGRQLVYNDPRRFGFFKVFSSSEDLEKYFSALGPEPLDSAAFSADYLFQRSRQRLPSVKAFVMDQKVVVGVGNIYASEALYRAGVRPTRKAKSLTRAECERIVVSIRRVLRAAIRAGGSTIRDYRQTGGHSGRFQAQFKVYDRERQPCGRCRSLIRHVRLVGRSTFYCPSCQE